MLRESAGSRVYGESRKSSSTDGLNLQKRRFLLIAREAYDGQGRLNDEPWKYPSKPMKSGFAKALQRAISMG